MRAIILGFLLIGVGCAHRVPDQEASLEQAQSLLENGKPTEALKAYRAYMATKPQSRYFESARLGEAQALENLGDYSDAIEIYRDVLKKTRQSFPEIATQALYRSSYSYEALGNEEQAISTLLDAHRLKQHLPVEIAEAEVPARLGLLYAKLGQPQQVQAFNKQALEGLERVKEVKVDQDWLARTYYQMGLSSENQISSDSLTRHMEALKWAQIYLIKAIKLEDDPWSERAYRRLYRAYNNVLGQVEGLSQLTLLERHGGELLSLIRQAELYKPLTEARGVEAKFYRDLAEIQKRAETVIYRGRVQNPVTLESEVLQGIKRDGRIDSDSLLPAEKISPISSP